MEKEYGIRFVHRGFVTRAVADRVARDLKRLGRASGSPG